jgi:predicted RND superfamily exporter protein
MKGDDTAVGVEQRTWFESVDGSHEVLVSIPDDRRHISELLAAMDEADKQAHRRGQHADHPREDCPLCPQNTREESP